MSYNVGYNELKKYYDSFKKSLPQDSFSSLYEELKIVRGLISAVNSEKLEIDTFEYQKIAENNLKQLHKLGYKKII